MLLNFSLCEQTALLHCFISEFSGRGHLLLSKSHLTELRCDVMVWKYVGIFVLGLPRHSRDFGVINLINVLKTCEQPR